MASLSLAIIIAGCNGGRGFRDIPAEGPLPAPPFLTVDDETQVATLHFPPGVYSLTAEDDAGYYYAAPRHIVEHTSDGPRWRDGGVYVYKRDPRKLRGYVYWGGARMHVGDISGVRHEFSGAASEAAPGMIGSEAQEWPQ